MVAAASQCPCGWWRFSDVPFRHTGRLAEWHCRRTSRPSRSLLYGRSNWLWDYRGCHHAVGTCFSKRRRHQDRVGKWTDLEICGCRWSGYNFRRPVPGMGRRGGWIRLGVLSRDSAEHLRQCRRSVVAWRISGPCDRKRGVLRMREPGIGQDSSWRHIDRRRGVHRLRTYGCGRYTGRRGDDCEGRV